MIPVPFGRPIFIQLSQITKHNFTSIPRGGGDCMAAGRMGIQGLLGWCVCVCTCARACVHVL